MDQTNLRIGAVRKTLGGATVRMLGYNGSIPGPTLRVRQGSELVVDVTNDGDLEATVHWHGLRLDNRYDGTTETQPPIPIGGRFSYRLSFPDPGVYWYHPHIREDYGQEMGLYGNIIVEPSDPDYWPAAHREVTVTLDDILIEDGDIAPFSPSETSYVAMGRFGNVLLVNGEESLDMTARRGEVVRFYLTNTANTRVFAVAFAGARMKLVGGDSGRVEREELIEGIVLAPSERAVVDVLFAETGAVTFEHWTPGRVYPLGRIVVAEEEARPNLAAAFDDLRVNEELVTARAMAEPYREAPPDRTISFVAEMNLGAPALGADETVEYFCPMHPDEIRDAPGKCSLCHMKLLARAKGAHAEPHTHGASSTAGGIEWEDDMKEINRTTTPANTRWKLAGETDWRFRVGDRVKIRLVNTMDSDHPMHHPFHIHGAGRFLILSRDGVPEPNLVWKDTVLVTTGQTVDILLDVTHAGRWMAHCHIAEHHESGMMLHFDVAA
jgi:FtsP/CotA-like multicopper oxidase with cupredoxin domain